MHRLCTCTLLHLESTLPIPTPASMMQQQAIYKRSFRSSGSFAAQTCRSVPARQWSRDASPTGWRQWSRDCGRTGRTEGRGQCRWWSRRAGDWGEPWVDHLAAGARPQYCSSSLRRQAPGHQYVPAIRFRVRGRVRVVLALGLVGRLHLAISMSQQLG